jgi:peptidoglycan/xylan/chitin deacetylase (PgdA/CDA1 family)
MMEPAQSNRADEGGARNAFCATLITPEQAQRALLWKRRLGRIWRVLSRSIRSGAPRALVLTYHSVGPLERSVAVESFAAQMRFLKDRAQVVALAQLLSPQPSPQGIMCAVTFDDGYAAVYDYALPVLRNLGLSATVYLTAAAVGDESANGCAQDPGLLPKQPMLTWAQVRDLVRNGIRIGSHLNRHVDLTRLRREPALMELTSSRKRIEHHTGSHCPDLSYPWGRTSPQVAAWAQECGYRSAVTSRHGPVVPGTSPFAIPRLDVRPEYTLDDFRAIVEGDWDYLGMAQAFRQKAQRLRPVH